ncbi:hypothetical protein PAHAL_9G348500 [Panicum hallii]|jgi:hypothetical protein|uniref:Uncharacterized protein n=1 Tax=Panicum hallii TaxID=206008 RepID=A0A2S3IMS4_9POAL|nr:hypothetical protein PAHAL_9G348500 [Panicum hallii]
MCYDIEASVVHFNFPELVLSFSHVNCPENFYVCLTWMTISGDTLQSLILKDKDIHLLNILKLNKFHVLYFLVHEISNASTDLIEINTMHVRFFLAQYRHGQGSKTGCLRYD